MANEFIARKGIVSRADAQITGSLNVSADVTASAFYGDGSNITGVVSSDTASYIGGLISFPNGLDVTGSLLVDGDISASGIITGSAFYGDGSQVTGVVSSSYALSGGGIFTQTGSAYATTNDVGITGSFTVASNHSDYMGVFYSGSGAPSIMSVGATRNTVSVQSAGQALYHGFDHQNNVEFLFGTSATQVVFVGSTSNHDLELRHNNDAIVVVRATDVLFNFPISGSEVTASAFYGDGSNITGVLSSSYSSTASYVETAQTASYFIGDIEFPSGLEVTGSLLVDGSISASGDVTASAFVGDGSQVTSVVSSSYALSASYADTSGGGWAEATVDITSSTNTGYFVTASAAIKVFLPPTSTVGDSIRFIGTDVGTFSVAQSASQQIQFGTVSSSLGTVGSLDSQNLGDSIELVCTTTDRVWYVVSSIGAFSVN